MVRKSYYNLIPIIITVALCCWCLAGSRPEFLSTVASLTPFYTTGAFFADLQKEAGGLLMYLASALTSCYAKPWFGTSLFTLLVCLLFVVQPSNRRTGLSQFIGTATIALLLLLNFAQQGYLIYLLKEPATGMSPLIGFVIIGMIVLSAEAIERMINRKVGKALFPAYLIIVILIGYPLFGFYGLFAAVLIWIRFVRQTHICASDGAAATNYLWTIVVAVLGLVSIFAYPYLLTSYCYTSMSVPQCYFAALPNYAFTEAEWPMWLPLMGTALLTLLFDSAERLIGKSRKSHDASIKHSKRRTLTVGISASLFVLSVAALLRFSFNDANFNQIVRMGQAVDDAHWEDVVEMAQRSEVEVPTRIEVLYRNLALQKLGRGGDELFQYPDGDAEYKAVRTTSYLRLIAAAPLYYYYGKANYSYRWCMEGMVEYGMRPCYLKYMALCAIVNGEKRLARKYLRQLSHTWFYRDFAAKYLSYLDQPDLMKADKDMAAVMRLMNYDDLLDGDSGLIEVYLLNSFAMMQGGTRDMVELSLQDNLILKDIDGFWAHFHALLPTFKGQVPIHYQEAALLFNTLEPRYDLRKIPFDATLQERFKRLIDASKRGSAMGDAYNAAALRAEFGTTYWYYYFFVKGLKTN